MIDHDRLAERISTSTEKSTSTISWRVARKVRHVLSRQWRADDSSSASVSGASSTRARTSKRRDTAGKDTMRSYIFLLSSRFYFVRAFYCAARRDGFSIPVREQKAGNPALPRAFEKHCLLLLANFVTSPMEKRPRVYGVAP